MKEFIPRAPQVPLISHMLDNPRCAAHAGTGIGKTSSTLAALDTLLLAGEAERVLVLGPKRVAQDTWTDEAAKWQQFHGLRFSRVMGGTAQRCAGLRADADIYLMNYENLPWLVRQCGGAWPFDTVVADESTRLKSFRLKQGGERTRALGRVVHRHVRRFIELTGTPAPNGLKDLWGQLWYLDGGQRLGRTYTSFAERWFAPSRDGYGLLPLPHAFEEISGRIEDLCLSIQAKDYFDLQEPVVSNVEVTLPDKAMKQYKEMEREMFLEISNTGVEAFNAASRTIKCLQLASGTLLLDDKGRWAEVHRAKIEALESIVEEAAGMPVLVSYTFVADRERLLKHFPGSVDLATPEGMRKFKAGQALVGIGHPASIGHGIDGLQYVTNIIVFFSSDYNLENRQQIIERIGPTRQFQANLDRPTFVYNLVAKDTLDELVLARVESKAEVQQLLLDRMRGEGYARPCN